MRNYTQYNLLNTFLNKIKQEAPSDIITRLNGLDITFNKISDNKEQDEETILEYTFNIKGNNHIFQLQFFVNHDESPYRLEIRTPDNKSYQITSIHLQKIGFTDDIDIIELKQIVKVSGQRGSEVNAKIKKKMCDMLNVEGLLVKKRNTAAYWHVGTYSTFSEKWLNNQSTTGFISNFLKVALILAYCRGNRGIDLSNNNYIEDINTQMNDDLLKRNNRVTHPEEFRKTRETWEAIGNEGELFVLEYEKSLLLKAGKKYLAENIVNVALEDCSAGYDIQSFELDGRPKYIECKTSVGKNRSFEISANEWSKAKQYREQYCIYRVVNLYTNPKVIIIKNPYKQFEEKSIVITPTSYKVKY